MVRQWSFLILAGALLGCSATLAAAQGDSAPNIAGRQNPQQQLYDELEQILQSQVRGNAVITTVPDVLFNGRSPSLTSIAQERLAKLARVLTRHPGVRIEVRGYVDNEGNRQSEHQLSQGRADSVKSVLVEKGVPGASVSSEGMGDSDPVASNDTPAGREQNRRVEIVIDGNFTEKRPQSTLGQLLCWRTLPAWA